MLAENFIRSASGSLDRAVQMPDTFSREIVDFIAGQLPRWRDRLSAAERQESEPFLTDRLCGHLNSATRHAEGWDVLQFRTEVPDELEKRRAIDLAAKPCGAVLVIDGTAYSDFQTILPVECKRLPTPTGSKRDPREYVCSSHSSTGGIQRFKAGDHGGVHKLGAMIAYVQEDETSVWQERISTWIRELAVIEPSSWSADDLLRLTSSPTGSITRLQSSHRRPPDMGEIVLEHLWLAMN